MILQQLLVVDSWEAVVLQGSREKTSQSWRR